MSSELVFMLFAESTLVTNIAIAVTIDDFLSELGGIAACRLMLDPPPGQATLDDLVRVNDYAKRRLVELIDSTLVEKAKGYEASVVAAAILNILRNFVVANRLGVVSGADGMFQLRSSVRGPAVGYVARERLPNQKFPSESYPALEPNLVVEVLSPGNTKGEMTRKRLEYFHSNVQIVWIVDCINRSVAAYTSPSKVRVYSEEETIDGGLAIPGFTASVSDFFNDLDIGLDVADE